MNIQAINASPTLGRRQVPRANNVSFGNNINDTAKTAAKSKAAILNSLSNAKGRVKDAAGQLPDAAKNLGSRIKQGFIFISSKALDGLRVVKGAAKNGFTRAKGVVGDFIKNHKGAKGIKIAATALTAVVAGGFAIKELYDIITKSNS